MIPFFLRVIKAELPFYLKTSNSLDSLYQLLSYTRREINRLKANQQSNNSSNSSSNNSSIKPELVDALTPLVRCSGGRNNNNNSTPGEIDFG